VPADASPNDDRVPSPGAMSVEFLDDFGDLACADDLGLDDDYDHDEGRDDQL
jgi:hypothetical protein